MFGNKSMNWNLATGSNYGSIQIQNNKGNGEASWVHTDDEDKVTGRVWCSGREDVDAANLYAEENETFETTGQCFAHNHAPPGLFVLLFF